MVKAIVGANWGDEGKGKITDILAKDADAVVRFQGGSNAGHTIINQYGKFALHQLPSGIFHSHARNILANGVALNIGLLLDELQIIRDTGLEIRLMISDRAHVLAPYHVLLDELEEERLKERKFGSTKSGIAPLYADKYAKTGLQVWELYTDGLKQKLKDICHKNNYLFQSLYQMEGPDYLSIYDSLSRGAEGIMPYIGDTAYWLSQAVKDGKHILLEGQLGALKDIDHGIYPYVTSSSTLAGYASTGAGIPPYCITSITAVTKAYSSAVGEGPFVTELFGDAGNLLREKGGDAGEYGATTGRPRRVGYFDLVATAYGARLQGATEIALTGIDVLSYMDEIPVCTAYQINGETIRSFPVTEKLYGATPIYETLPGFKKDIRGITEYRQLPSEAKNFIEFIQEKLDVKISYVSTGPKRDEIIML